MKNFKTISALALGALTAASALAATDGPHTVTYPGSGTVALDFPQGATIALPQFNMPGATLTGMTIDFSYSGVSNIRFENLGQGAGTVNLTSRSVVFELQRPGGSGNIFDPNAFLNASVGLANRQFSYSAFDGTDDFAGTSGITFTPEEYNKAGSTGLLTSGSDLTTFTGAGTVTLPILNKVGYSVIGGGSSDILTPTTGSASVSVTYTYTTNVPEPKVYGAIGAVACLGLLGYRRFRNNQAAQA